MTPRHVRALRGTAAAWVATVVAATAHTLGGGGAPSPAFVAAVGTLAAPLAVALMGRRLSAWRTGATVLASQALFHAAFAVTADADPAALHGHHATRLGGISDLVLPDAPMLAAHVLAAAVTVAALYGGERMLRALGRGIRSVFARARVAVPQRPAPPAATATAVSPPLPRVVLSDVSRRGPPVLV